MRRALLAGLVAVACAAPAAHARPTMAVQGSAISTTLTPGVISVRFECAAADVTGQAVVIETCGFGPLYAPPAGGTGVAFTSGGGTLRLGAPYFLCVVAQTPGTTQSVTRCGAYDALTGTAVVAG